MIASAELEWHGLMAAHVRAAHMDGSHLHPEVELNLLLRGAADYVTPWGRVPLPPRRLTAFWGGFPHRLVSRGEVDVLVVTVPLSTLIGWPALEGALGMMMRGHWLVGSEEEAGHDAFLLRRWIEDLSPDATASVTRACEVELHARFARLGLGVDPEVGARLWRASAADRLLVSVARGYAGDVSVAGLAEAAGVHPTYAAKVFRESFGMPLWEYVTLLRVAHAVRLLTGSDWGVDRIAFESGFQSRSSFYRAFGRFTGRSPAALRRTEPPPATAS